MPFVFCDESDTVKLMQRNIFVYACLRLNYSVYENLESDFLALKDKHGKSQRHEVKWKEDRALRQPCLETIAKHPAEIFYYVVTNKREFSGAERYRRKALEAAFRSICGWHQSAPLVVLDERSGKQDRYEAMILQYMQKADRLPVPAYVFLPSHLMVGLQLVDMVAGALRTYEADGEERYYTTIKKLVKNRVEVTNK